MRNVQQRPLHTSVTTPENSAYERYDSREEEGNEPATRNGERGGGCSRIRRGRPHRDWLFPLRRASSPGACNLEIRVESSDFTGTEMLLP